jgi:hypothetical protein
VRGAWASGARRYRLPSVIGFATALVYALPASSTWPAPITVENYWEESVQQLCISTNFCAFDFSTVPSAKTLIITNVSCGFSLTSTSTGFSFVELMRKTGAGNVLSSPRIDLLPAKKGEIASTIQFWAITNQVSHIVRGSQRARIEATVVSGAYYGGYYQNCTVMGILKP